MGLFIVFLVFTLDALVVWQLLRSNIPLARLFIYLTIILLFPVIGITIYYISELLIPKLKTRKIKP